MNKFSHTERLENGAVLAQHSESLEDEGERIVITWWEMAHSPTPRQLNYFVFSLTMLESQKDDAAAKRTIDLLNRELRVSKISNTALIFPGHDQQSRLDESPEEFRVAIAQKSSALR